MQLIPYEPFRHLENMRRELDRFFTGDLSTFKTGFGQNLGSLRLMSMKPKMKSWLLAIYRD